MKLNLTDMCRLLTPKLEETLKGFPLYSQDDKKGEAICCAIFVIGRVRWFIIEGEREGNDVTMFGISIGLMEDEYCYVSLNEISDIEIDLAKHGLGEGKLHVTQLQNFIPRPLKEINDIRLKRFLARFED